MLVIVVLFIEECIVEEEVIILLLFVIFVFVLFSKEEQELFEVEEDMDKPGEEQGVGEDNIKFLFELQLVLFELFIVILSFEKYSIFLFLLNDREEVEEVEGEEGEVEQVEEAEEDEGIAESIKLI